MTDITAEAPAKPHSSHWGAFTGQWVKDRLVVRPHPNDPDPNPILDNFPKRSRTRRG
jgi:biotin/methionine sulfoxide reductase